MHVHDFRWKLHANRSCAADPENGQLESFDEIPLMIYFTGTRPFPLPTPFRRFVTRKLQRISKAVDWAATELRV